ncbi:hypothetical protein PVK06_003355 [Gossypium arboreum]|uniref:Uncharacterized protein n=1 Tax=Gossypium arboreum TaxID=29729 RepID=A0ABR0R796_GOSAR|nr:hypothetical protein PVK06_003355 [Gossypium arboreum]
MEHLKVQDLFNTSGISWDEDLINEILTPYYIAKIMKCHVNMYKTSDCMISHYSANRKFIVKTSYRVVLQDYSNVHQHLIEGCGCRFGITLYLKGPGLGVA